MKDPLSSKEFKDPLGSKNSNFKETGKALIKGAVTLAIALPLIGAVSDILGGNN